jgi:hypothetical protein
MTGAHSRTDEDPVQSVLGNVGCLLLLASVLALVGLFAYLLATDSKDLPIPLMALQGLVVITYARRLALKILRNRSPSPVILADWISESARVIAWTVVLLITIGEFEGWMHGAVRYALAGILGLFIVCLPLYWWRGQRRLVLALTARLVESRWPWSAGG